MRSPNQVAGMSRNQFAGVVELIGVAALVGGLFIISWPIAIATLGGVLILTALVISKGGY